MRSGPIGRPRTPRSWRRRRNATACAASGPRSEAMVSGGSTRSSPGRRSRRTPCRAPAPSMISRRAHRHAARAGSQEASRHPLGVGRVRIAKTSGPDARSIRPTRGRTACRYSASPAGSSRVIHRRPPPRFGIGSRRGPVASALPGGRDDHVSKRTSTSSEGSGRRRERPYRRSDARRNRPSRGFLPPPRHVGACSRAGRT